MILYHWTCDHAVDRIKAAGEIVPNPWTGETWATTLEDRTKRTRLGCGLTSNITNCDRMVHRFRIIDPTVMTRWLDIRDPDDAWVQVLEAAPGVQPETWWVARNPVPVVYDPPGKATS